MSKMWAIIRMNMKLLFRNKGFLFFLCITPIMSAIILSIKVSSEIYNVEATKSSIIELSTMQEKALYLGDTTTFIVKVYDAADSELGDYVLERLASTGMFSICRASLSEVSNERIIEQAKKDAYDDRCGALLYLKEGFEEALLSGNNEDGLLIFPVSDDERYELFIAEFTAAMKQIYSVAQVTGQQKEAVLKVLNSVENSLPHKEIVTLSGKDEVALTNEQNNYYSLMGYALSFITLGFLLSGVYVAHTVIEEQGNKVYTRVMLSKMNRREYFISKVAITIMISTVQTIIFGVCIFAIRSMEFGIRKSVFLLIIFCTGIVFSTFSLLMGVLIGDIMSSNYAVFAVWSISSLLAGMYFPLDDTSKVLKAIANLMPQKWYLDSSKLLMVGDKGAYSVILYVTVAYLILFISIGSIGLKMKRSDP